jgi:16S rRNA processing protein RimM
MLGSKLTPPSDQPPVPARPKRTVNRRRPAQLVPAAPPVENAPIAQDVPETAPAETSTAPAAPKRQPVGPQKIGPLAFTEGPEPDAPLSKVRLAVGTIVGPHGVDGELKMRLSTDDPEHLLTIKHVYLDDAQRAKSVLSVRFHAGMALIKLHGVWSREEAKALVGSVVRIAGKDARPLEPGEFYLYQLVGLEVFNEAGEKIGDVIDLMETGANDVFVIKPTDGGKEFLLPNHPDIVPVIDPANRRMVVRPLEFYGE